MPKPDRISFCVHSFNEAEELRRLVLSSLPFAAFIDDWVIVDHRSNDGTQDVIEELRPELVNADITLTTRREERDLSQEFPFAAIRNLTLGLCRNEVAALMDADFILGPSFAAHLQRSIAVLRKRLSPYYAGSYSVPVIWDRLVTDKHGIIRDHGRIWVHQRRPRILFRPAITFKQVGRNGRWEKLIVLQVPKMPRVKDLHLSGNRRDPPFPNAVISCNVKGEERIRLRGSMTMFMEDVHTGRATGDWLENYAAGKTRDMGEYPFQKGIDLRGWRLNAPNLKLGVE